MDSRLRGNDNRSGATRRTLRLLAPCFRRGEFKAARAGTRNQTNFLLLILLHCPMWRVIIVTVGQGQSDVGSKG